MLLNPLGELRALTEGLGARDGWRLECTRRVGDGGRYNLRRRLSGAFLASRKRLHGLLTRKLLLIEHRHSLCQLRSHLPRLPICGRKRFGQVAHGKLCTHHLGA